MPQPRFGESRANAGQTREERTSGRGLSLRESPGARVARPPRAIRLGFPQFPHGPRLCKLPDSRPGPVRERC